MKEESSTLKTRDTLITFFVLINNKCPLPLSSLIPDFSLYLYCVHHLVTSSFGHFYQVAVSIKIDNLLVFVVFTYLILEKDNFIENVYIVLSY